MNTILITRRRGYFPVMKYSRAFASLTLERLRNALKAQPKGLPPLSPDPIVTEPQRPLRRRSRLSPERRAELLAAADRGYEELRRNPEALAEELEEGRFLDAALHEPIIEE